MPADSAATPADERELVTGVAVRRRRRLHPLAVVSLILGLLSMRPLAAIAAVLTGLWARRSIRRSEGRTWGRLIALVGVALGCIGLAITAISAHQMIALYRDVTPLAEQLMTMLDKDQWRETYDLFEPTYRDRVSVDDHEEAMRRLIGGAEGFEGLRWAYRLDVNERSVGGERVRVMYDGRFRAGRGRYLVDFIRTSAAWHIERVRRI